MSLGRERSRRRFCFKKFKNYTLTGKSLPLSLSITPILTDPGSVRHRNLPDESPRNQSGRNFNSVFGHKKHRNCKREKPNVLMTFLKGSRPRDLRRRPPGEGKGGTIKSGGGKGRGPIKLSPVKVGARFSLSGPIKGSVDREAATARLSLAAPSLIRTPVTAAAVITGAPLPPTPGAPLRGLRATTFLLSLSTLSWPRVTSLKSSFSNISFKNKQASSSSGNQ
ncbi:hypothetical protein CEXT_199051 [Caerostris extrusa]|uniref:Ribosomal protein L2 n=1 Tax=Caerostris extrusa TaxID=172846 RepID=A0AAV4WUG2_CAEEX|nr:hypothetical protein CEXT_199051 [Caerostris extrusa]